MSKIINADADVESYSSPQYPGDINQALIELGSTVCRVREPSCETCPLKAWCSAYQEFSLFGEPEKVRCPHPHGRTFVLICYILEGAGY